MPACVTVTGAAASGGGLSGGRGQGGGWGGWCDSCTLEGWKAAFSSAAAALDVCGWAGTLQQVQVQQQQQQAELTGES